MKALALDMGGVLIELDINAALEAFRTIAGFEEIDRFLDSWHQRGFFWDYEGGLISEDVFFAKCLEYCRPGTTPEDIVECYRAFIVGIDPEKVEIVNALKEKYELYLLSNNNYTAYHRICRQMGEDAGMPFDTTFKKQFNSFQMQLLKPGDEMYRRVIAEIGKDPSDIIFVDDSQTNIDAALKFGIDARLYRSVDDLRSLL